MTEHTRTEHTAPEEPAEDVQETPEEEPATSNREARYRRQLRDAEAERDTLRGQVETLQRAEAERVAAAHLARPEGLWAAGTALPDLLDDEGDVDPRAGHRGCPCSRRRSRPGPASTPAAPG